MEILYIMCSIIWFLAIGVYLGSEDLNGVKIAALAFILLTAILLWCAGV